MHHQIDSLAHTNRLRCLPPTHKLGFAATLFILGYAAPPLAQAAIALWLSLWIVGYAQIPATIYARLLLLPISFWLMSVPALLLGFGLGQNLGSFQADVWRGWAAGPVYIYLSRQGWQQASAVLMRAIALTSCLYFILLTVPFVEILRVLRQLRCPSLMIELLALMYRFIFMLATTATELATAQRSRGGYLTWRRRLRSLSIIVSQLMVRTLENYRELSLGLQSRGFTGELRVWHHHRHQPSWRYGIEAIAGCMVLTLITVIHHSPKWH
ncbi:MAG: cobalt ECF transporter T component CbiQ [Cyanobacteria bacterium J06639_14]